MIRRLLAVSLPLVTLAGALLVGGAPASARADGAEAALAGLAQVTAGTDFSCARLTNREVRCWGNNGFRQLGDGSVAPSSRPVAVTNLDGSANLTGVTQIASGGNHSCARVSSGQVRCWGYGLDGQTGHGSFATPNRPIAVLAVSGTSRLGGVTQLAAGWNHTCARVTGGQVRCWGGNASGQLGNDSVAPSNRPVVVQNEAGNGPLTGVTQIAAGLQTTCARMNTGKVMCWGENSSYQMGDGFTTDRHLPVFVSNPIGTGHLSGVASVAIGYYHGCARLTTGQARCWGGNSKGQIGAGAVGNQPRPFGVLNGTGTGPLTGVTRIAAGYEQTCATFAGGRVRCWGDNTTGQLGDRSIISRMLPRAMVAVSGATALIGATGLALGEEHTCVALSSGQAVCVGDNGSGRLGDGTLESTTRPVSVKR